MDSFTEGSAIKCRVTFTDEDDAPVDPATVAFRIVSPRTGTATDYSYGEDAEVVRQAAGIFYVIVAVNEKGVWNYRFTGVSGQNRAVVRASFVVTDSNV